ncbi:GNAT family N-acetyltransferase [Kangiella sediminilitoris]|uniref:MarR family transcriptional regulator n=1 Tax=Kangiella sediminilitoris TaxID=1144748 RepID=A0A1B3B8R7_9GAMM|nr:GNAT family N-acetyltransferase [Kangiella sediminilitoris]AOE49199.1 MarR family transcriptional regulator [Kangiella sediminilitoris]
MSKNKISIERFSPELAEDFKVINQAWIEKYFVIEDEDKRVLNDPKRYLIDTGGEILFARDNDSGEIIAACALKKWTEDEYELSKMGVLEGYQGSGVGKFLAKAIIEEAKKRGCKRLFLESNRKLKPAMKLYQQLGFKEFTNHESRVDYSRCDIVMEMFL